MPWPYIRTKDKFDGPVFEGVGLCSGGKTLHFAIWMLHMCIRPNVSKAKQLEHKRTQKMKCMPTDII